MAHDFRVYEDWLCRWGFVEIYCRTYPPLNNTKGTVSKADGQILLSFHLKTPTPLSHARSYIYTPYTIYWGFNRNPSINAKALNPNPQNPKTLNP